MFLSNDFKDYNFLTIDEVNSIVEYYDQLDHSEQYSSNLNRRKLMHYDDPNFAFMKDLLEPKFKKLFPNGKVSACTFTDWHTPVEIHTDGWQPQEDQTRRMGYVVLIPLRLLPLGAETSTIIFNQSMPCGPGVTMANHKDNEDWNIHEFVSSDDERIENKEQNVINDLLYDKYFTHVNKDFTKNLKINNIHNWTIGSAIIWNRKNFHTSSSFNTDLVSKLHAIFFITLDKD